MCGRCRVLASEEVHVVAPPGKAWPRNRLRVEAEAILGKWRPQKQVVSGLATDSYAAQGGESALAPEPWAVAAAYSLAEGRLQTQPEFCRLAEARGWAFRYAEKPTPRPQPEPADERLPSVREAVARAVRELAPEELGDLAHAAERDQRLGLRTEFQQVFQDYWYAMRRFHPSVWRTAAEADQLERLDFIRRHLDAVLFRALSAMTEAEAEVAIRRWEMGKFRSWLPDRRGVVAALRRVGEQLGLRHPLDTPSEWNVRHGLEAEIERALGACFHITRPSGNPPPKTAVGAVKAAWSELLGLECGDGRLRVAAYTDGSFTAASGAGGSAVVLWTDELEREFVARPDRLSRPPE